ncbi:MAG: putative zinc-binding metallopeptidase [Prevotella sp.]|nr:putative zinc-binding metallopeptidase [Prevotella sp.]
MKRYFIYALLLAVTGMSFTACSEDELDSQSVIVGTKARQNDFDKWLEANFVIPYNIEYKYRYEDGETDLNYYEVPPRMKEAIKLAHIVKYTCVEAYNAAAGVDFTRRYFPKLFYIMGEWEYENNGNIKLGVAEGGKKIYLLGANYLDNALQDKSVLDEYYLKTIHHEFTHILNQTQDYPKEYSQVTPTLYVNDDWSTSPNDAGYLQRGFVSAYSQKEVREDFAEMVSTYVITPKDKWEKMLKEAVPKSGNTTGRDAILAKLKIAKTYFKEAFNIDLDVLRDEIVSRELDVVYGKVNLDDLTVK